MTSRGQTSTGLPHSTGASQSLTTERTASSACALHNIFHFLESSRRPNDASRQHFPPGPQTSQERLDASLTEHQVDIGRLTRSEVSAAEDKGKTYLYLAYGSNLCDETFRGARGINPISQINVVVPELRLTFDLPGIPYTEPCFANSARRDPKKDSRGATSADYHKDRWHKGMVGVVYEVTPSDYAHIIATEGGGSTYNDILVACYPLPDAETVPESPSTPAFKAHTLFAPIADDQTSISGPVHTRDRFSRPDPSYAQPSARYLKLLTDGAIERSLPAEYQTYLRDIRPYTMTTKRQAIGQKLFQGVWMPFVLFIFGLQKMFQDDKGRTPDWLATLGGYLFLAMWTNYDAAWKRTFGDGERTIGQDEDDDDDGVGGGSRRWRDIAGEDEKQSFPV